MGRIDGNKVLVESLKERIMILEAENARLRALLGVMNICDVK